MCILWASCQIHKIANAHAQGMTGTFSPPPRVSNLDMHHGTCVTHVPWLMSGSLISGFLWSRPWGKTFPACATRNLTYLVRGPCNHLLLFSVFANTFQIYANYHASLNPIGVYCGESINRVVNHSYITVEFRSDGTITGTGFELAFGGKWQGISMA